MSTTTINKRPKLDDEGSTMASTKATNSASPYGTILELALPFLSVDDDLFPNICLVSKGIHQHCLKLFDRHCQDHYPMLVFMEQTQMQNRNDNEGKNGTGKNDDEPNNDDKRWLTYKRYRSYQEETKPKYQYDYSQLAGYELILEISTCSKTDTEEEPHSDSDSSNSSASLASSSTSSSSSSTNIMGEDAGKKKRSRDRQICESKQAEEEHFGEDGGSQGHKRPDQSLRDAPVKPKPTELLLAHDIQPLCVKRHRDVGCTFRVDKIPCSNKDMREGIVRMLQYRVRVIMRRKSTGEIVIVMNTTKDESFETQTDFWHAFIYQSDEWYSEDERTVYSDLSFARFRTSTGEVAFIPYAKVVEDDDSDVENFGPVEIEFEFSNGRPENVLEAIDSWRWL